MLNQLKLNLNNHLFLRQNLIEKITVDMFIGAIHLNPLIRANLAALRIGELINQKGPIIKCKFSLLNTKVVL